MTLEAPKQSAGVKIRGQGAAPLQTLVSVDSADIFPPSDFAASLQQWHEDNKPAGAINLGRADTDSPRGALPRKTSIKTPRAAGHHALEKQPSSQLARVASCASPSDLYTRKSKTKAGLTPIPTTDRPGRSVALQDRQPSGITSRTPVQKQPSMSLLKTPLQKQPSINTPRTPIQDRQPPWRQGSGEGKPRPCVTRSMQRKLEAQLGSLPNIQERAASTAECRAHAAEKGVGDSGCTADPAACTSGIERQQGAPSKEKVSIPDQGAGGGETQSGHGNVGAAADNSEQFAPAEHEAAWTSKIAAKVASIDKAPPDLHAHQAVSVTIRPVLLDNGAAKSTAAGASPAQGTPRLRGFRLPWTPKGEKLLPQQGSCRSPRMNKEGALGHIDPQGLVTKRLPRIKVRYRSGERLEAKPGRSWGLACFQKPPTKSS